jgi:hypothetical protein
VTRLIGVHRRSSAALILSGHKPFFLCNPNKINKPGVYLSPDFCPDPGILKTAMTKSDERTKKDRTPAQDEASRNNGKLSRGPVTPEGKQRASKNSLKHGLFAKAIVLENERKENFTNLTRQYRRVFHPNNALEEALIQELAAAYWRMRRVWAMETHLLNKQMPDQPLPAGDPDDQFGLRAPKIEQFPDDLDEFTAEMDRTTSSFNALAGTPGFRAALQQEGRLHRNFHRALRGLVFLRKEVPRGTAKQNGENEPKK